MSIAFQAKNVFNSPGVILRDVDGRTLILARYTREGAEGTFELKGTF